MGRFDIVTNNTGVNSNRITQDIVFDNLHIEGFDVGLVAPTRRSTVIEGGLFNNVRNLLIGKGGDTIRSLDVTEPITFVTPTPAQLAGRTPLDVSVTQAWYITENVGRKSESLFSADDLRMKLSNGTTLRLYYADQAATAKPFPTVQSIVDFNSQWVNKTNLELSQNYGLWFNGGGLPAGAFTPSGFVGLAVVETAAFPTDFDGNNRVDGGDFLAWQRGLGVPAAVQANGDANGDREVDELDLDLWADDFGAQGAFSAASGAAAALTAPTSDPVIPITPDLADAAMAYVQMTEEMEEAPAKTSKWRRFRPWF
jgi:hypothetical protein